MRIDNLIIWLMILTLSIFCFSFAIGIVTESTTVLRYGMGTAFGLMGVWLPLTIWYAIIK